MKNLERDCRRMTGEEGSPAEQKRLGQLKRDWEKRIRQVSAQCWPFLTKKFAKIVEKLDSSLRIRELSLSQKGQGVEEFILIGLIIAAVFGGGSSLGIKGVTAVQDKFNENNLRKTPGYPLIREIMTIEAEETLAAKWQSGAYRWVPASTPTMTPSPINRVPPQSTETPTVVWVEEETSGGVIVSTPSPAPNAVPERGDDLLFWNVPGEQDEQGRSIGDWFVIDAEVNLIKLACAGRTVSRDRNCALSDITIEGSRGNQNLYSCLQIGGSSYGCYYQIEPKRVSASKSDIVAHCCP